MVRENERPKYEDYVETAISNKCILNIDRTIALVNLEQLKQVPKSPPLEVFELIGNYERVTRRELESRVRTLAVMLKERYGYTLDDKRVSETVWYLRQVDFLIGELTVYYFKEMNPVFIVSSDSFTCLVVASLAEEM